MVLLWFPQASTDHRAEWSKATTTRLTSVIDHGPKCPVSFITAWPQVSLTIAWPLVSLTVAWPLVSWPTLDYWSVNPRFTTATFGPAWPPVSLARAWPLISLTVAWPLVSWPTLDYWSVNPRFTTATFGPAWPPVSLARAWPLISLTIAWPLISLTISCPWACDKLNCFRGETNELGNPMSLGSNEPGIQWAWDPMSRGNIGMLPYRQSKLPS